MGPLEAADCGRQFTKRRPASVFCSNACACETPCCYAENAPQSSDIGPKSWWPTAVNVNICRTDCGCSSSSHAICAEKTV